MPSSLDGGILTIFTIFAYLLFLLLRLAMHSRDFLHQPISPIVLNTHSTSQRYKYSLLHIFALVIRCVTFDQVSTSCLRATIATLTSLTTTREVISFQTRASEDRGGGDRPDRLLPPELAVSLRSEGPGKASLGEA